MEARYYIHVRTGTVYGHTEKRSRDPAFRRMSDDEVEEYLNFIRLPAKRPAQLNEALTLNVDGER